MAEPQYQAPEFAQNPRDLVDDFVEQVKKRDPDAQYVVIVTDPRDRRCMSIRVCGEGQIANEMTRHTVNHLLGQDDMSAEETPTEPCET